MGVGTGRGLDSGFVGHKARVIATPPAKLTFGRVKGTLERGFQLIKITCFEK